MEQRRAFLKRTTLGAIGTLLAPSVLKASDLFTAQGKAKHVIMLVFRGVGKEESTMDIGYRCMPNLFGNPLVKSKLYFDPKGDQAFANKVVFSSFSLGSGQISHSNGLSKLYGISNQANSVTSILGTKFMDESGADYNKVAAFFNTDEITNDLLTLYNVAQRYKSNRPMVISALLNDSDIAHYNYSKYCQGLYSTDKAIADLWNYIQTLDGGDETLLVAVTDHGRNSELNEIVDVNGFGGKDHGNDSARQGFCVIVGDKKIIDDSKIVHDDVDSANFLPCIKNLVQLKAPSLLC